MTSDTKQVADFSALAKIKAPEPVETSPRPESWPDRSPHVSLKAESRQISVRATLPVIARFQHVCREERYSYGEMLERLLDAYESRRS